jgi:DNA adenine methylase
MRTAQILCSAELIVSDFEEVIGTAMKDDFIYLDPPYTVMHNNNNFIKYNSNLFSWGDQVRLAKAIRRASKKGVCIMLSNANHESITSLYQGFGNHRVIERTSVLAGDRKHRGKTTELLITNFRI